MTTHTKYECATPCQEPGSCRFCDGGLFLCTVCGGAEGSLPIQCPGYKMTPKEEEDVYAGRINYTFRQGWFNKNYREA